MKAALFARYSRSPKSLRRLFLDEFLRRGRRRPARDGRRRATSERAEHSTSACWPSTATTRSPSSAARTSPSRVLEAAHQGARVGPADGLPRAIDALHPVHDQPGGRWRYHVPPELDRRTCGPASSRALDRPSTTTRAGSTRCDRALRRSCSRGPDGSDGVYRRRSARRRSTRCAACCRRRRTRTSASSAPGRPTSRCCCACAPIRWPRRAPTPRR